MFKCLPFALLGVVVFSVGSSEAQLFRRLLAPRAAAPQPMAPSYRAAPGGPYAGQQQFAQPQVPQRNYYRRVQVAPGRFALVPVQPNGATNAGQQELPRQQTPAPQDIARRAAQGDSVEQATTLSLEGPQTSSQATARTVPAPAVSKQIQQTQQRYRRVTVYNTRTGQRSTRLIPIPSATLAQQPYVYGQNGAGQPRANPRVVTGTLVPPAQPANVGIASNEIRLDSQVQQATVVEAPVFAGRPQAASAIPVSPEPQLAIQPQLAAEPQPAIATPLARAEPATNDLAGGNSEQFSVLVSEEEASDDSAADIGLELAPPAN